MLRKFLDFAKLSLNDTCKNIKENVSSFLGNFGKKAIPFIIASSMLFNSYPAKGMTFEEAQRIKSKISIPVTINEEPWTCVPMRIYKEKNNDKAMYVRYVCMNDINHDEVKQTLGVVFNKDAIIRDAKENPSRYKHKGYCYDFLAPDEKTKYSYGGARDPGFFNFFLYYTTIIKFYACYNPIKDNLSVFIHFPANEIYESIYIMEKEKREKILDYVRKHPDDPNYMEKVYKMIKEEHAHFLDLVKERARSGLTVEFFVPHDVAFAYGKTSDDLSINKGIVVFPVPPTGKLYAEESAGIKVPLYFIDRISYLTSHFKELSDDPVDVYVSIKKAIKEAYPRVYEALMEDYVRIFEYYYRILMKRPLDKTFYRIAFDKRIDPTDERAVDFLVYLQITRESKFKEKFETLRRAKMILEDPLFIETVKELPKDMLYYIWKKAQKIEEKAKKIPTPMSPYNTLYHIIKESIKNKNNTNIQNNTNE